MKMKRFIAAILLVLTLTAPIAAGEASASGERFVFSLSASSAPFYQECPVVLAIDLNPGISAGALNITYDHSKVSLKRFKVAANFSADIFSVVDNKYGQIRFTFLSSAGVLRDTGAVLTLYFVPVSLSPCDSEIAVAQSANAVYDDEYAPAAFACAAGRVTFVSGGFWASESSSYHINYDKKIITGVLPGTSAVEFSENFGGNFKLISTGVAVGTGARVEADLVTFYVVVRGDATGDGAVGVMDYIAVRLSLLGITPLSGVFLEAADTDNGGKLNVTDYILIRLHLLGVSDLYRQN